MNHKVTIRDTHNDYMNGMYRFEGTCICGSGGSYSTADMAAEWAKSHIQMHTGLAPVLVTEGDSVIWEVQQPQA